MTLLIAGVSGSIGRLTEPLLKRSHVVKMIVRSPEKLSLVIQTPENLRGIQVPVLDLSDADLAQHVADLITNEAIWQGQMPVIYNKQASLVVENKLG